MSSYYAYRFAPDKFAVYGQMRDLWVSDASVKMAAGTYDAGKTYSLCAYMDALAMVYPGARMTFVHRSLTRVHRNIIPTYYKYLGYTPTSRDHANPTFVTRYGGEKPEFFEYGNGTRIHVNGLDQPANLLSDFFDAAFVNQAELLPFEAWDELKARVSERAGVMPITQLFGDCNPNVRGHWIRQQAKEQKLAYYALSFLDNPEIVDQSAPELAEFKVTFSNDPDPKHLKKIEHLFSESGLRRVEKLKNLEGLRFKRGFLGEWGGGEGLVFDRFDPETHILSASASTLIMPNWPRYMSIDWGFRAPSSVLWWARSPDDRLYAYKEIYQTQLTKPELIELIVSNCDAGDRIRHVAVDSSDQDGIAQLRQAGFRVNEPKKDRVAQMDSIKERLKVDRTGQPALFFLRDRLVHAPDEDLKDAYEPLEATDEFEGLEYPEKLKRTPKGEEEVIGADHSVDGTGYLLLSLKRPSRVGSGRVIHDSVKMR